MHSVVPQRRFLRRLQRGGSAEHTSEARVRRLRCGIGAVARHSNSSVRVISLRYPWPARAGAHFLLAVYTALFCHCLILSRQLLRIAPKTDLSRLVSQLLQGRVYFFSPAKPVNCALFVADGRSTPLRSASACSAAAKSSSQSTPGPRSSSAAPEPQTSVVYWSNFSIPLRVIVSGGVRVGYGLGSETRRWEPDKIRKLAERLKPCFGFLAARGTFSRSAACLLRDIVY